MSSFIQLVGSDVPDSFGSCCYTGTLFADLFPSPSVFLQQESAKRRRMNEGDRSSCAVRESEGNVLPVSPTGASSLASLSSLDALPHGESGWPTTIPTSSPAPVTLKMLTMGQTKGKPNPPSPSSSPLPLLLPKEEEGLLFFNCPEGTQRFSSEAGIRMTRTKCFFFTRYGAHHSSSSSCGSREDGGGTPPPPSSSPAFPTGRVSPASTPTMSQRSPAPSERDGNVENEKKKEAKHRRRHRRTRTLDAWEGKGSATAWMGFPGLLFTMNDAHVRHVYCAGPSSSSTSSSYVLPSPLPRPCHPGTFSVSHDDPMPKASTNAMERRYASTFFHSTWEQLQFLWHHSSASFWDALHPSSSPLPLSATPCDARPSGPRSPMRSLEAPPSSTPTVWGTEEAKARRSEGSRQCRAFFSCLPPSPSPSSSFAASTMMTSDMASFSMERREEGPPSRPHFQGEIENETRNEERRRRTTKKEEEEEEDGGGGIIRFLQSLRRHFFSHRAMTFLTVELLPVCFSSAVLASARHVALPVPPPPPPAAATEGRWETSAQNGEEEKTMCGGSSSPTGEAFLKDDEAEEERNKKRPKKDTLNVCGNEKECKRTSKTRTTGETPWVWMLPLSRRSLLLRLAISSSSASVTQTTTPHHHHHPTTEAREGDRSTEEEIFSYIIVEAPGPSFDPALAKQCGVPAGPLYGALKQGVPVEIERTDNLCLPKKKGKPMRDGGEHPTAHSVGFTSSSPTIPITTTTNTTVIYPHHVLRQTVASQHLYLTIILDGNDPMDVQSSLCRLLGPSVASASVLHPKALHTAEEEEDDDEDDVDEEKEKKEALQVPLSDVGKPTTPHIISPSPSSSPPPLPPLMQEEQDGEGVQEGTVLEDILRHYAASLLFVDGAVEEVPLEAKAPTTTEHPHTRGMDDANGKGRAEKTAWIDVAISPRPTCSSPTPTSITPSSPPPPLSTSRNNNSGGGGGGHDGIPVSHTRNGGPVRKKRKMVVQQLIHLQPASYFRSTRVKHFMKTYHAFSSMLPPRMVPQEAYQTEVQKSEKGEEEEEEEDKKEECRGVNFWSSYAEALMAPITPSLPVMSSSFASPTSSVHVSSSSNARRETPHHLFTSDVYAHFTAFPTALAHRHHLHLLAPSLFPGVRSAVAMSTFDHHQEKENTWHELPPHPTPEEEVHRLGASVSLFSSSSSMPSSSSSAEEEEEYWPYSFKYRTWAVEEEKKEEAKKKKIKTKGGEERATRPHERKEDQLEGPLLSPETTTTTQAMASPTPSVSCRFSSPQRIDDAARWLRYPTLPSSTALLSTDLLQHIYTCHAGHLQKEATEKKKEGATSLDASFSFSSSSSSSRLLCSCAEEGEGVPCGLGVPDKSTPDGCAGEEVAKKDEEEACHTLPTIPPENHHLSPTRRREPRSSENGEATRTDSALVFMGTGSAVPSKYRNVSGAYMELYVPRSSTTARTAAAATVKVSPLQNDGGDRRRVIFVFDWGEGSSGQLVQQLGAKAPWVSSTSSSSASRLFSPAVSNFLRDLSVVFISHGHADHHLGLLSLVELRHQYLLETHECEKNGSSFSSPLIIVCPVEVFRYMNDAWWTTLPYASYVWEECRFDLLPTDAPQEAHPQHDEEEEEEEDHTKKIIEKGSAKKNRNTLDEGEGVVSTSSFSSPLPHVRIASTEPEWANASEDSSLFESKVNALENTRNDALVLQEGTHKGEPKEEEEESMFSCSSSCMRRIVPLVHLRARFDEWNAAMAWEERERRKKKKEEEEGKDHRHGTPLSAWPSVSVSPPSPPRWAAEMFTVRHPANAHAVLLRFPYFFSPSSSLPPPSTTTPRRPSACCVNPKDEVERQEQRVAREKSLYHHHSPPHETTPLPADSYWTSKVFLFSGDTRPCESILQRTSAFLHYSRGIRKKVTHRNVKEELREEEKESSPSFLSSPPPPLPPLPLDSTRQALYTETKVANQEQEEEEEEERVFICLHEATFGPGLEEEAKRKCHSTLSEAVQMGLHLLQSEYLVLNHFSQRYPKIPDIGSLTNGNGSSSRLLSLPSSSSTTFVSSFEEKEEEEKKIHEKEIDQREATNGPPQWPHLSFAFDGMRLSFSTLQDGRAMSSFLPLSLRLLEEYASWELGTTARLREGGLARKKP